jgi:hypothetical protein
MCGHADVAYWIPSQCRSSDSLEESRESQAGGAKALPMGKRQSQGHRKSTYEVTGSDREVVGCR